MTEHGGTRPTWMRAVGLALAAGPYVGAGREAARTLIVGEPWKWWDVLAYVGVWTLSISVFGAVVAVLRRRRADGDRAHGRALVEQALVTGDLPEHRNPAAWQKALAAERQESRQVRWLAWGAGLLVAALVAAAAVASSNAVVGALAVALAVALVVPDRRLARRTARADSLLARL